MEKDMQNLGYTMEYGKVDAQNYLLPQRRNRIYATADVSLGPDAQAYADAMQATMDDLASDALMNNIFDESLPKSELTTKRQTNKLAEALEAACLREGSENVFMDGATSEGRVAEYAVNVLTCVRPSHQRYSQRLRRWVTVKEMFLAQGLFDANFANPEAVQDVLQRSSAAQGLAGNAFASTCTQAKMLASMVHSQGWQSIAQQTGTTGSIVSMVSGKSSGYKTGATSDSLDKYCSDSSEKAEAQIMVSSFRSMPLTRKRSVAETSSDDMGVASKNLPVVKRARGKRKPEDVGPTAAAMCIVQFQKDETTQKDCKTGLEIIRKHNAKKRSAEPIANGEPAKKRKYTTNGKIARDGKSSVVSIWKKMMLLNASRLS